MVGLLSSDKAEFSQLDFLLGQLRERKSAQLLGPFATALKQGRGNVSEAERHRAIARFGGLLGDRSGITSLEDQVRTNQLARQAFENMFEKDLSRLSPEAQALPPELRAMIIAQSTLDRLQKGLALRELMGGPPAPTPRTDEFNLPIEREQIPLRGEQSI